MAINGTYSNNHYDIYPPLTPEVTLTTSLLPETDNSGTSTAELSVSSKL
jgi:hypothetical protein